MRRYLFMLLSFTMIFTLVVTVSASSGSSPNNGEKVGFFIDMATCTSEGSKDKDDNECFKFDLASHALYGSLFLNNKINTLDKKFIPYELVPVSSKTSGLKIPSKNANALLKKDALAALNSMYTAASNSGIKDMVLSSGYRSYSEQSWFYNRKVNTFIKRLGRKAAEEKASQIVAPPGSSEHQTGLAVDITTRQMLKNSDPLTTAFSRTACGQWMLAHSWEFGYVLRYQQDKTHITGITYEPWHFRYVGRPHSEIMNKNKFCLEEYIKYLKNKSRLSFTDTSGSEYEIVYACPPPETGILNIAADKGSWVEVSRVDRNGYVITVKKPANTKKDQ